ncbi:hypothetical protein [Burkholderia contaminans]|uniref:hypothetical protein n=1 Tax=Burkholderia contaminans TaxID=488447 RepID=UPI003C7AF350
MSPDAHHLNALRCAAAPGHPDELGRHRCIGWRLSPALTPYRWEFAENGRRSAVGRLARRSVISLHCHALDLDQQAGMRELGHAYRSPRACAAWKDPILHLAKYGHMRAHLHVVCRHVDNIFKSAPSRCQNHAQIFPARQELRFGIGDDFEVNGTPDLSGAKNNGPSLHGRYVTGALHDMLHRRRDDQFTDGHVCYPLRIEAVIHRGPDDDRIWPGAPTKFNSASGNR